ncbi:hypothetical protein BOX15_Mlig032244g3 [Macrostomum lignano]|uniref:Uncharacterized protein n=1 Tax=Macrostomum lignano TaxID=282301 RepID=A0A267GC71_9PLAT|nr:hypothetical protein BOX15_Mlig032244g3 [Macrostomum lignano]
MSSTNLIVPAAPAFLDPLIEIESCYYYAVPRFFGFHHPNTRWLIAMIKAKEEDQVKRKIELNPELFKGRYFQMVDHPKLYLPDDPSVTPMFKRQSVLYLTALGISIYLRSLPLIDLILFHKDPYGAVVGSPYEPQFASHLQDLKYGDFHAFPPCVIMLRMYCFESTVSLQQAGWNPTQPLALPMRRRFERRAFYFYDWLEAALGLLSERPLYPLQSLILNMTRNMTIYKFLMLPTTNLLPPTPKQRVPTGLIDVEELPVGTKMVGVRSLLEMAEDYDRYLQMRSCAIEVAALKREATAVGLNPEILMIQAQDYDGYVADKEAAEENENNAATAALRNASNVANSAASISGWWRSCGLGRPRLPDRLWAVEPDTRQQRLLAVNANNSATNAGSASTADAQSQQRNVSAAAKKKKKPRNYVSEALRVLYYALEKDKTSKRMQVCLDSIIVLSKRGFFVNGERLPADSSRARDLRNVVTLVLNMIQREQEKLDVIFAKIQSGYKKFQHLEEHKMLENRRLASVANISKMIALLTRILLHSKELVFFVNSNFPPFPANTVDFTVNYRLQTKFNDIKIGVVQEFNSIKDGWTYLSKEMLEEVAKIKSMQLHFRVGKQPSAAAIIEAKKAARKSAMRNKPKNKSNMSNTNSCFVTFRKVQRIRAQQRQQDCLAVGDGTRTSAKEALNLLSKEAALPDCTGESENRWWASPLPQSQTTATAVAVGTDADGTPAADANDISEQAAVDASECYQIDAAETGLDEEAQLLHDLTEGCDGLSETGLLMNSLYREVQDLLKSQGDTDSAATRTPQSKTNKGGCDDTATIEPKPGTEERISLNQSSYCGRQGTGSEVFDW